MCESKIECVYFNVCVHKIIEYEGVVGVLHSTMLNFPSSAFGSRYIFFQFQKEKNMCAYSAHILCICMYDECSNGKYVELFESKEAPQQIQIDKSVTEGKGKKHF